MSKQDLMIEVVHKLLNDKTVAIKKEELPTAICSLLRPFASRAKPSKELDIILGKLITSYGICSRCRSRKLKRQTDAYCQSCKSVLKEQVKELIV
jgi:hypothetical protein